MVFADRDPFLYRCFGTLTFMFLYTIIKDVKIRQGRIP
jgi:hypothetical protein